MATQATYYLDAPSLSSATVIYSDAGLTTVAPDGFYSDGTISREQSSGVLLPQVSCPSCATPCGGSISASGAQGIYYLSTDLGTDTGAVVVTFDPYSVPDGILATFNSNTYNGLSSPVFGWLQGSAGLATYIGDTSSNCGVPSGSPYTLNEYEFDGTNFVSLGTTTSVPIFSGQLQFTAGVPGNCVMVIPKTTASPSILDLQFIGPCSGTAFEISVACPAILTSFDSSTVQASSVLACADTIDQVYYVAHVTGAAGVLGLYDLVFSDGNGEFKLAAGYYKTNDAGANDWFQVNANGVIVAFGTCTPSSATLAWNFTESLGGEGTMDIYVNGLGVESRNTNSSGSFSLNVGDTIYVDLYCSVCSSSPNTYSNAYTISNRLILSDASCQNNGSTNLITATYTVVSGDIGTTITLDSFISCDGGCV